MLMYESFVKQIGKNFNSKSRYNQWFLHLYLTLLCQPSLIINCSKKKLVKDTDTPSTLRGILIVHAANLTSKYKVLFQSNLLFVIMIC